MESQPQNPEFRNNPENFHPCNRPDQYNKKLIEPMLLTQAVGLMVLKFLLL